MDVHEHFGENVLHPYVAANTKQGKRPGKALNDRWDAWQTLSQSLGQPGLRKAAEGVEMNNTTDRVLQTPTCTLLVFIAIVAKLAFCAKGAGGCERAEAKEAAVQILKGLIKQCRFEHNTLTFIVEPGLTHEHAASGTWTQYGGASVLVCDVKYNNVLDMRRFFLEQCWQDARCHQAR